MTKVTGGSDDLIEITGDLDEEFNWINDDGEKAYLSLSDGTVLSVMYDQDGIWRFNLICQGHLFEKKIEGSMELDTFDEVHFKEGLKWCLFGEQFHIKKTKPEIIKKFKVNSSSSNRKYIISQLKNNDWQCDCPVWIYKRKLCKHIQSAQDYTNKKNPQLRVEEINA